MLRGQGTQLIQMGEGGGHATDRGRLRPFVEGRGPRRQQWCHVRRGRVQRSPVCGTGMVAAFAEWVCRRDDHYIVLRGGGGEEVCARSEYVHQGADRDVVLQHVQVACSKGRRGGCRVEGRGVSPGPEVDRLPVHVVRLGQGDPGEASVRQEVVAEDRLRAGVLHNNRGRMRVRGHCWRDLARAVVRCRGPGALDDVGGAVDLPWLD